jgi:Cu(I)/Ag(I) efflux system membrane fusion protein
MNRGAGITIGSIVLVAVAAAGGYWLGNRNAGAGGAGASSTAPAPAVVKKPPQVLYYRNPMGLPDTSPVPKKDPMGMDYVPVFEDGEANEPKARDQIRISTDKIQKLGVRTEAAELRMLDKMIRAAGRIEPDERHVYSISPKFEGYVERLHVNVTGQPVQKGQPLFEVYSPELISAQREYAIASGGVSALKDAGGDSQAAMKQLADSSLLRLKNWDISEEQVRLLAQSGEARRTLTFRSPVSGIVTEKKAVQGMRFMPGESLYQVTDLSSVWVVADVFEQDIGLVKTGARAKVTISAYPGKVFEGRISYIYPTLKAETRTISIRVELANPGGMLKPAMFAEIELSVAAKGSAISVPLSAVIDSGTRRIVLVQAKEGRYEPREVKLGARSDKHVEVLEGVKEGDQVVVAANFLIDAESNLKAAVGGFGTAGQGMETRVERGAPAASAAGVGHRAEGTVDTVDVKAGTVILNHAPVASLNWLAMTMEFKVANTTLLTGLKPGAQVAFEFVERQPGEWVITSIKPAPAGKVKAAASPPDNPRAGH